MITNACITRAQDSLHVEQRRAIQKLFIPDTLITPLRFVFALSTCYPDDDDSNKAREPLMYRAGRELLTAWLESSSGSQAKLAREYSTRRNGNKCAVLPIKRYDNMNLTSSRQSCIYTRGSFKSAIGDE